jgi:hypothetical protein
MYKLLDHFIHPFILRHFLLHLLLFSSDYLRLKRHLGHQIKAQVKHLSQLPLAHCLTSFTLPSLNPLPRRLLPLPRLQLVAAMVVVVIVVDEGITARILLNQTVEGPLLVVVKVSCG